MNTVNVLLLLLGNPLVDVRFRQMIFAAIVNNRNFSGLAILNDQFVLSTLTILSIFQRFRTVGADGIIVLVTFLASS